MVWYLNVYLHSKTNHNNNLKNNKMRTINNLFNSPFVYNLVKTTFLTIIAISVILLIGGIINDPSIFNVLK